MRLTPKPGECYHVRSIRATVVRADVDGRHVWVNVGKGPPVKVPISALVPLEKPPSDKSPD